MSQVEDMMDGTVLVLRGVGRARKVPSGGWLVIADNGKPFTATGEVVPAMAGRPVDRKLVKTKAAARKTLLNLKPTLLKGATND